MRQPFEVTEHDRHSIPFRQTADFFVKHGALLLRLSRLVRGGCAFAARVGGEVLDHLVRADMRLPPQRD